MINAALNLVQGAVAQSRPQIIAAQISTTQPAPTSFTDPLFVQNPSQPDNFWRVDDWTVDHGGTLPVQGAACELAYDFTGALRCIWWDGMYSAPSPGGTAGGDLSNSFPDPTVAKINGVAVPLTGSAWTAPTLLNGYSTPGGFPAFAYLKDPVGFIHVRGFASQAANTGGAMFQFPVGFRPGTLGFWPVVIGGGATIAYAGIDTSGNLTPMAPGGSLASGFYFNTVTFLAEN